MFSTVTLLVTLILNTDFIDGASFVDIGNLPATVTVFEDVRTTTFLHSLTSYPTSATCSITSGDTGSNFALTSSGGVHQISTVASPSFDHSSVDSYTLVITCVDSPSTASGTLTVSLINNVAPTFTNLPGRGRFPFRQLSPTNWCIIVTGARDGCYGSRDWCEKYQEYMDIVTISAKTVKNNHVIYTVSYMDPDSTPPLSYTSVTTTPASGPFTLANDMLTVTVDLLTSTESSYVISFSVSDERTTITSSITVTITDINVAPDFILPLSVNLSLPEDKSGRLEIYDINHVDVNNDPVVYSYETYDANNDVFDLVGGTGEIFLIHGNSFDYETTTDYTFKVRVADELATGTATFTLFLFITNVNERPTFNGTYNNVTVDEGTTGNTIGTLSTYCTDPDGDPLTYSIVFDTYSSYFTIADNSTPTISFANTWDYDGTLPNVVNITVRCSDPGGFSDDAIYTINITDINDNDPVCTPSQTLFNLYWNQTVNETILAITCTDADSQYNANLTFVPVGLTTGYTLTYFNVDANGTLFIKTNFTMDFNTTFYVNVLVTDRGNPSRSTTVTLTVSYTAEPIIITYEEITRCFFCTTGSISIVSALAFAFFIIFSVALYLLVLKLCFDRERKKIIRKLQKKKKNKWRWFGCLRPGYRNIPKKSKDEIRRAELRDLEYMRARNALKGNNDRAYLHARNAMLGPKTESASLVTPGGRALPSKLPQKPGSRTSQPLDNKRRRPGSRHSGAISVISGNPSVSLVGRDKAPSNLSGVSDIERKESQLTVSQREQLDKFREMRLGQEHRRNQVTESSSRHMKGQAANEMVWTFQGRE